MPREWLSSCQLLHTIPSSRDLYYKPFCWNWRLCSKFHWMSCWLKPFWLVPKLQVMGGGGEFAKNLVPSNGVHVCCLSMRYCKIFCQQANMQFSNRNFKETWVLCCKIYPNTLMWYLAKVRAYYEPQTHKYILPLLRYKRVYSIGPRTRHWAQQRRTRWRSTQPRYTTW